MKGYIFIDSEDVFCDRHSMDRILDDPTQLSKVVKKSKKEILNNCPACKQNLVDGFKDWCRVL